MTVSSLTREEARVRAEQISVNGYDVTIDLSGALDPARKTFGSRVAVTFTANEGAQTFIDFVSDSLERVCLNGRELDLDDVADGDRIRLPHLAKNNELIVWGRAIYSRSGEGLHRYADPSDGRVYTYTQYEPADCRRVFAVFEQPDLKATFRFTVITPPGWLAASNGELVGEVAAPTADVVGAVAHEFAPSARISSYITTILAGPYVKVTDEWVGTTPQGERQSIPLSLYCRWELEDHLDAQEIFKLTKRGLDFFPELFDYAYPFGKYEQAFVPEYNLGAMENPGMVTFTESYLYPSGATRTQLAARANTLMHEMCHMWFGDLVTMTWWDDLWLKESFAEFMGAYACVQATEYDDAWVGFALQRKEWAYRQDQMPTTHPIVADIVDLEAARQNFDGITYAKGASVLKQLVAFVGETAFIEACRTYFRRYAYGNTTLEDFLKVLEEACDHDVRGWADSWLMTTGVPELSATVIRDPLGKLSTLALKQNAQPLRPHVVGVACLHLQDNGALAVQGEATARLGTTGVELSVDELVGQHADVVVLNHKDLTYCLVDLDPQSMSVLLAHVSGIDDDLTRALGYGQLWTAVRGGSLDPRQYVHLVAESLALESHSGILTTIVDRAMGAVEHYVPQRLRAKPRHRLLECVFAALQQAAPASDAQLILARAFARLATWDGSFYRQAQALLDGSLVLPGLEISSQLSWSLMSALTATFHTTSSQLEAAREGDGSRDGYLGYLRAVAAMQSDAAKERAWEQIMSSSLSNDELAAVISGFKLASPTVLRTYEDAYFARVLSWWSRHSMEIATRMVRGLYPATIDASEAEDSAEEDGHRILRTTSEWLDLHQDAPNALRRIMVELRDEARRALRMQVSCR